MPNSNRSGVQESARHGERLFRLVNEKIRGINEGFGFLTDTAILVCECPDLQCLGQIELPLKDYDSIRSDSSRYIALPGHEPSRAQIVGESADFVVFERPPSS
jgi:hypothetical protein